MRWIPSFSNVDEDSLIRRLSFGFLALVIIYLLAFQFVSTNQSSANQARLLSQLQRQTTEIAVLTKQIEGLGGVPSLAPLLPTTPIPPTTVPTSPSVPPPAASATYPPPEQSVTPQGTTAPSRAPVATSPPSTSPPPTSPRPTPAPKPCKTMVLTVCLVPG